MKACLAGLGLLCGAILIGCGATPSPQTFAAPSAAPEANRLPSDPTWRGGCEIGVGRDAILAGSASDPRVTWGIDQITGNRMDLLWPVGYTARFGPNLEVIDRQGNVIGRAGDLIIGSCLIQPEDGGAVRIDAADIRPPNWQPGDG